MGKDIKDRNLGQGTDYHKTIPPQGLLRIIWLCQQFPQQVQKEVGSLLKHL